MKKEIGKRIQKLRQELHMSKEAFAKEIGITFSFEAPKKAILSGNTDSAYFKQ